ncbi:MAG: DUF5706 domain-containing protein [Candidatus Binatia bacterium]
MQIQQPGGHLDQMMRQTRGNLIQLSSMADVKSSMLLTLSSLVLTLAGRYVSDPVLRPALVVLAACCLLTIALAIYAAMPKVPVIASGDADVADARFNLFYFGDFVRLDYGAFRDAMETVMNDPSRTYEMQVREVYTLGRFLAQRKYRYLRLAYLAFLSGLLASAALVAVAQLR